jgi:DNA-binding NarL/FixJ family response regulator
MGEKGASLSMRTSDASSAVVFDRHPLWRQAIGQVLDSIGIRCVGKATSAQEMVRMVEALKPDLLMAEPSTGRANSSEVACLRHARELHPALRIVVVSASDDVEDVATAFDAGAIAYVLKTAEPADIATAIRQAFSTSVFLRNPHAAVQEARSAATADVALAADLRGLTRRELEILKLVGEGYTNSQLAGMLWVTEQTVKFHLSNVYRKLNVSNRTEASRWAQLHGLLGSSVEHSPAA